MAAAKKQLLIEILSEVAGVKKGTDEAARHLGSLSTAASKAGDIMRNAIGLVSVAAVAKLGQELYRTALQSQAFQARFNAVFGDNTVLRAWARDHTLAFGTAEDDIQGYLASIANMLTPLGLSADAAGEQAKQILETAGAWSVYSGGQISVMDAADKLTRGMLGQTRGLQELGLNAAAVRDIQGDLEEQTDDLTGSSVSAEEAQARWKRILEQSGPALSMYGTAMEGPAGQALELSSRIATLKDDLADTLMPALAGAAEGAIDFAAGIQQILDWFRSLPSGARTAALAIGGVGAALTAAVTHPVLAGLALAVGYITAMGAAAQAQQARITAFRDALLTIGQVDVPTLTEFIDNKTLVALDAAGISIGQIQAALGDTDAMMELIRKANAAGVWADAFGFDELLNLNRVYMEAAAAADVLRRAEEAAHQQQIGEDAMLRRLELSYGGLTVAQGTAKRTTEEWATALSAAKQRVIDLTNAQIAAASPVLQAIQANQGLTDAKAVLAATTAATVGPTGTYATEADKLAAVTEAELALVEAEGRRQGAQALLSTQLGEASTAFRDLAEDAGLYGDELERIIRLMWDYDRAPKPEPNPYDSYDDDGNWKPT